jgi:hypothetical protein
MTASGIGMAASGIGMAASTTAVIPRRSGSSRLNGPLDAGLRRHDGSAAVAFACATALVTGLLPHWHTRSFALRLLNIVDNRHNLRLDF